jgi:hypothetical protein
VGAARFCLADRLASIRNEDVRLRRAMGIGRVIVAGV